MILRLYRTSGSVDIQRSDRAGIVEGEEAEVACRGPAVSTARTAPSLAAAGRVAARHWPAAHHHPRSASRGSGGGSYWRTRVRAASVRASRCDLNDRTLRVTSRHVALL